MLHTIRRHFNRPVLFSSSCAIFLPRLSPHWFQVQVLIQDLPRRSFARSRPKRHRVPQTPEQTDELFKRVATDKEIQKSEELTDMLSGSLTKAFEGTDMNEVLEDLFEKKLSEGYSASEVLDEAMGIAGTKQSLSGDNQQREKDRKRRMKQLKAIEAIEARTDLSPEKKEELV